jgi:hypothetical protein
MTTIANLMGASVPALQAQVTVGKPVLALTAAGTNQATATAITNDFSVFTTVGSGTGARLPVANAASMCGLAGDVYIVVNNQATNALLVYPPTGGSFVAAAASASIPAGKTGDFYCLGNNVWAPSVGG